MVGSPSTVSEKWDSRGSWVLSSSCCRSLSGRQSKGLKPSVQQQTETGRSDTAPPFPAHLDATRKYFWMK